MSFVKKVSSITKKNEMILALQELEAMKKAIVRRKNPAIAKYI